MPLSSLLEKNWLPDFLIRWKIRQLHQERLQAEGRGTLEQQQKRLLAWVEELKVQPLALEIDAANKQHYEVPTEFYQRVLGAHLKYSCAYWKEETRTLDEAEEEMLKIYVQRARIQDGQAILELGCGWGSLSLYLAKRFPQSEITAVSNSKTQKIYIDSEIGRHSLKNLTVLTEDIRHFQIDRTFDRIVSIEMMEHLRNIELFFKRIASWLKEDGLFFLHIFTHKQFSYPFIDRGPEDWMARYFFTGGMIPSDSLPLYFQNDLQLLEHWRVDGTHYQKTAEAWLERMDQNRPAIFPLFEKFYGSEEALKWWVFWRVFFMACSEMWGFAQGREWLVSHYLFQKKP